MSEENDSILEDLERYRRNNFELAVALNELKSEFNIVQQQVLDKNRELQTVHSENAALKQNIVQKDNLIGTWRALIIDLVTTNTKKYTELMQNVGLVPSANGTTKPIGNSMQKTPSVSVKLETVSKVQRRERPEMDEDRLPDLTEESINSQFNQSLNLSSLSPEVKSVSHVTSRRRTSAALTTPSSPLRMIQERFIENGETKRNKPISKVPKLDEIPDENTQNTKASGGRPARKTAPKNLSEPKLSTKMRRN